MNQLGFHSYRKIKPWENFEFTSFIVSLINDRRPSVKNHFKKLIAAFTACLAAAVDQSVIDNAIDE